jgi:hypothetical protein
MGSANDNWQRVYQEALSSGTELRDPRREGIVVVDSFNRHSLTPHRPSIPLRNSSIQAVRFSRCGFLRQFY